MRIPQSKTLRLFLSGIFVFTVLSGQRTDAQGSPQPPPPFQGNALPAPPQQGTPWTPPTGPPSALLSATTSLFDEGLADPRGCDYRQITIAAGDVWSGNDGEVHTHGWVRPVSRPDAPRFAVCWNGLVYPALSVGQPADLHADMDKLIADDAAQRAEAAKRSPDFPFPRMSGNAFSEAEGVSVDSLLPIKACLLLRLGEGDLARRFWTAWTAGMTPNVNNDDAEVADPYLRLADDWAWALFNRAVCDHMYGDDHLSLISAQKLTDAQPKIEAEAARRGYAKPGYGTPDKPSPYLYYLGTLPALVADENRRVTEPPRPHPVAAQSTGFPDMTPPPIDQSPPAEKAKRIAALIVDLENVSARQWSQPGGVSLSDDPIVRALIGEGDDAVEPLLDALVHDDRLTRSVGFGRSFFRGRSLLSVSQAAYVALTGIVQTSIFSTIITENDPTAHSTTERAQIADQIRAYWLKHKGQSQEERWYQTLADDSAPPGQWLQAAEKIVQPDNVATTSEGLWITESVLAPDAKPTGLRGESLRAGHSPSVTDLMARRVSQIAPPPTPPKDSDAFIQMQDATRMALMLSAWDARAAVPVLRAQWTRCQALLRQWDEPTYAEFFAYTYAEITDARLRGHDPSALSDYARGLSGVQANDLHVFGDVTPLAPLWKYAEDPVMRATAKRLFDTPGSLFNRLTDVAGILDRLPASPLLGLPAFQRQVLRELADPTLTATLTINARGDGDVSFKNNSSEGYTITRPVPIGTKVIVRRSDWYAWNLAKADGMQAFDLLWPLPRRNSAIAADAATLRRYGAAYRYDPRLSKLWEDFPEAHAHLTFARLTRPATEADVKAGRAIFTLGPGAKVAPMPSFPAKAQLLATGPTAGEAAPPGINGWVWQSEEDAAGNRFFGFVGPGILARVPAASVRFLP